jgi:histone H3/H4
MPTNLVKVNNIRKAVEELDKGKAVGSISNEFGVELNKKVEELIDKAIKRAKANNRRTLLARDL